MSTEQHMRGFKCKLCHATPLLKIFQWVPIPHNKIQNLYNGLWDLNPDGIFKAWCPLHSQRSCLPGLSVLSFSPCHTICTCCSPTWMFSSHSPHSHLSSLELISVNRKCSFLSDTVSNTLANIDPSLIFFQLFPLTVFFSIFPPKWEALESRTMSAFQNALFPMLLSVSGSPW